MIPQALLNYGINFEFIEAIEVWGIFSNQLYSFYQYDFISYILSIFGILIYFFSQNIFYLFKFPKINYSKLFRSEEKKVNTIKKEPLINSVSLSPIKTKGDEGDEKSTRPRPKNNYHSPSLEILDTGMTVEKRRQGKATIQSSSDLLEKVFGDFNIEIQVINVRLGPVVTLFEIFQPQVLKLIQS